MNYHLVPALVDDEVRSLGYEPTRRGWTPASGNVAASLDAAEARRRATPRPLPPTVVPGEPVPCCVCDEPAEPSSVGTPTCSGLCTALLAHRVLPELTPGLLTTADGSGGLTPVGPSPASPKSTSAASGRAPRRSTSLRRGAGSIEQARGRLRDCRTVLERHGHRVGRGNVFCVFHPNTRTPAMSLFEKNGVSRFHCHSCGEHGDALDLEAYLAGTTLRGVIRQWSA